MGGSLGTQAGKGKCSPEGRREGVGMGWAQDGYERGPGQRGSSRTLRDRRGVWSQSSRGMCVFTTDV